MEVYIFRDGYLSKELVVSLRKTIYFSSLAVGPVLMQLTAHFICRVIGDPTVFHCLAVVGDQLSFSFVARVRSL